ncbi:NADP-dependent oxidoreductase domain-containing protein [Hypoxylon cercidicola]|nr:NADP-dependent oxidoreductase domain-containing protein [Hypoxylon cercidicola]
MSESGPIINIDSSPENCLKMCKTSLKRLGVDCIDLYYCHRFDKVTPIEKTVEAMVQLKNEGKIKYLGLSECSSDTLRRAHAVHPITAAQVEYSPWTLDIEDEDGTNLLAPEENRQIRDLIGTLKIVGTRNMALGIATPSQLQDTVPLSS